MKSNQKFKQRSVFYNRTSLARCLFHTHAALNVFELGQDVKAEAISLASGSIATIHEVTKGQNQT